MRILPMRSLIIKKDATFRGMGGRWNEKRLDEGIIFGGGGVGFDLKYPEGDFYEYTLMAWVK